MRISTHIKSFVRFELKLVLLVTCCSDIFDIFVTFFILLNINPPSGVSGGGYVVSGGGCMWVQVGEGGGFRWGCSGEGEQRGKR